MPRILSKYAIREVALPTLLALLTITFILLIGVMYDLIDLVLRPGVSLWQVAQVLGMTIPSFLLFAAPMAALVGTLIGVGRMTLDREVLAIRAVGINIFKIFVPMICIGLLVSGAILWLNGGLVPRLMLRSLSKVAELQFELVQTLEPGRFHNRLAGKEDDVILYFRERDAKTSMMKGVTLKLEEDLPEADLTKMQSAADTMMAKLPGSRLPAAGAARTTDTQSTGGESLYLRTRNSELTMIFAEAGEIKTELSEDSKGRQTAALVLSLLNGSIHRLAPDPAKRDYVVIPFQRLEKRLFTNASIKKQHKTRTNSELREAIAETKGKKSTARRELVERYAMSLAFFVFTLLGIPLAIWIRPTGKSWGILLAIGLMLVYYVMLKLGLAAVEVGRSGGVLVAFMPDIVFTVLGAGLWWHNLRN